MGLDTISYCLVMEELGRADSSVRGIVSVQNGLVGKTVAKWATDEQRAEWLPRLASGEALGCYALTEPGSGSDPASLTTRAERDGDDWLITGSKIFITLGTWAKLALVFARTGGEGARGITCFLVPTDSEGFDARPIKGKLGLRAQDTGELFLERRPRPRLGAARRRGRGVQGRDVGSRQRADLARRRVRRASHRAVSTPRSSTRASEPSSASRSPASSSCRSCSPRLRVETDAARLLTWRAAALADRGERHTLESSVAKYYASEASVRAANAAVQVHGGYGYVDEYPVGKYLRDARVTTLYEGTSQVQKLIIGRALTGESAFT